MENSTGTIDIDSIDSDRKLDFKKSEVNSYTADELANIPIKYKEIYS